MSQKPAHVPCSSLARAGLPCRAWAVHGSDPPACSRHLRANLATAAGEEGGANRPRSGAPVPALAGMPSPAELAQLQAGAGRPILDDEIDCARQVLHCLIAALDATLGKDPPPAAIELTRLANAALQAIRTIARLLRDQQALAGGPAGQFEAIFELALDALGSEWGVEL
jgi:hypothetical protein